MYRSGGARSAAQTALSLPTALTFAHSSMAQPADPKPPVAPIVVLDDLPQVDAGLAIPREDIEGVKGRKLVAAMR